MVWCQHEPAGRQRHRRGLYHRDLGAKRLDLLRQFVPKATKIAMLVYPGTPETEAERKDVQAAAQSIGRQVDFLEVRSARDVETAFATLASRQADALLVGTGPFIDIRSRPACRTGGSPCDCPTMYANSRVRRSRWPDGLRRQHARRLSPSRPLRRPILKGEKPARPAGDAVHKFEFVINLKTAKALGLEFHPQLLATADEVIE